MKETKFAQYFFLQSRFMLPIEFFNCYCYNIVEKKSPFVFHKSDGKQTVKTHMVMRAKYLPWAMNQNNYSHMKILQLLFQWKKRVLQWQAHCQTLLMIQQPIVLSSEPLFQQTAWHGTYVKNKQWLTNENNIHIIT